MAGSGVPRAFRGVPSGVSGCSGAVLLQNQRVSCSSRPFDAFFISGSSSSFMGSSSMVSFEDVCGGKRSGRSFFHKFGQDEIGDEDFDDYLHQTEKKRRLTVEQVQFLEKSFEAENRLEPERKIQLAKDLGLQPRQVAIWFQNRRARWKTKQLEKDFDTLLASYDSLKDGYDNLLKEKEKLQAEVVLLSDKLRLKEREQGDHSNPSNTCDLQLNDDQSEPIVDSASESEDHHVLTFICKHEDLSSAKSDVLDSGSPHYVDGGCSSFAELGDSSYAFEADRSDISQDDEDYLSRSFLPASLVFPKIEYVNYPDPRANSCNFELPGEDHAPLFWPYWDVNLKT